MMETTSNRIYEFGPFRLDMSRRLLLRDGAVVPLTHKAFEMLALMVENSGRIVEKDELLKEIWPDTFVEEGSLSRNISVLRKTLGEGPSEHQYIQTIPKQGYRFVANVRQVYEPITPAGEMEDQNGDSIFDEPAFLPAAAVAPRVGFLPYLFVFLLVIAVAALGFALYSLVAKPPPGTPAMTVTRFTNTGKSIDAAISPDGRYVVYVAADVGQQSLWVKQVATGSPVQIVPPANVSFQGLTFSQDGDYVFYNVWDKEHVGAIYRIPALGGASTKVVNDVMPTLAISPDNQRIAYVRSVASSNDQLLLVAKTDGTDEQRVSSRHGVGKGWFWQPAWSPDGKMIACALGGVGEHGSTYTQVIALPATGGEEKIVSAQQWVNVRGLAWMHDGSGLIMTASEQIQTPMQLWSLSFPDGNAKRITNDVNGYFGISLTSDSKTLVTSQGEMLANVWVASGKDTSQPQKITSGRNEGICLSWTPDGRIVYVSQESGNDDIWIMDGDGGNRKQLTIDPSVDYSPSASSDGKYIVFVSLRGGAPHIWRMNMDGSDQQQLTHGDGEWSPASAPTSPWMVYISTEKQEIWKLPVDGGEPAKLPSLFAFLPAVSPDGTRIVYTYWDDDAKPARLRQVVADIEGTHHTQSFEIPKTAIGQDSDILLRWSPDGRAISYVDNRGGASNIWSTPLTGAEPVQITSFKDGQIFSFDWSRDGRLAFARGTLANDVVLITNFK